MHRTMDLTQLGHRLHVKLQVASCICGTLELIEVMFTTFLSQVCPSGQQHEGMMHTFHVAAVAAISDRRHETSLHRH